VCQLVALKRLGDRVGDRWDLSPAASLLEGGWGTFVLGEAPTQYLTRTNVGASPVWLTFTPLQGVSTVVKRFLHEQSPDRYKVVMTIDDVGHYSDDEKQKIIASYPAHEAEARVKGIPVLGSGRVFPVAEETLAIENRDFPPHWPRIGGMDFGWDHPFAPSNWCGTAMLTVSMWLGRIG
jgi:Terminase large subunit, T4likevirus-type, N-terminal